MSLCGFATDKTDCPQRTLTTLGPLSYASGDRQAMPKPPPLPPRPPPSPPPAGFTACSDTCSTFSDALVCSDGGEGAFLVDFGNGDRGFECDYGTQCAACGTRLQVHAAGSDSYSGARNGICQDTVVNGDAGYGACRSQSLFSHICIEFSILCFSRHRHGRLRRRTRDSIRQGRLPI